MTTLDPIEALLNELTIESAKELSKGYVVYSKGMARVIDAIRAALPAQLVAFGPGDDSDPALTALKYIAEDGSLPDKTRRDARVAAVEINRLRTSAAPSQQEGVTEEMVDRLRASIEKQTGEGFNYTVAWHALEAALVDRDQVKP